MSLLHALRPTDPRRAPRQPQITLPPGNWHELDHPRRIPPLSRPELTWWPRAFLAAIRIGAGDSYDYTCFLVTARLGRAFPLHTLFFTQLLQHGAIAQADNECVVVRVAWRMGCQYEYAHHTRMALELGVPRATVESLTNEDDPDWAPRLRTLLEAADELIATKNLSAARFDALRRELDDDQIFQFTTLVGHYVMASMMLGVAGVQLEPAFELAVQTGRAVAAERSTSQ